MRVTNLVKKKRLITLWRGLGVLWVLDCSFGIVVNHRKLHVSMDHDFFGPAFGIVVPSPIVLGDWGETGTVAQAVDRCNLFCPYPDRRI